MLQGFQVDRESDGVERSIAERFEGIVDRYPDRLAAKSRDRSVSYRELNEAANRIRYALLTEGPSGNDPIALLFEHGVDVITGMFGALKADLDIVRAKAERMNLYSCSLRALRTLSRYCKFRLTVRRRIRRFAKNGKQPYLQETNDRHVGRERPIPLVRAPCSAKGQSKRGSC